jgi:hypothetical protein
MRFGAPASHDYWFWVVCERIRLYRTRLERLRFVYNPMY